MNNTEEFRLRMRAVRAESDNWLVKAMLAAIARITRIEDMREDTELGVYYKDIWFILDNVEEQWREGIKILDMEQGDDT